MDVSARLPGCDGQAADAISAYTQVKCPDAPRLLKIPKSDCPDIWVRLPRHKWPKSWSGIADPVVPLERNFYGPPTSRPPVVETVRGSSAGNLDGKKIQTGNVYLFIGNKDCSSQYTWMTLKWLEEAEYGSNVEEIDGTG